MAIKCKRIINGKTYNTETATQIAGWSDWHGNIEYGGYLYQSRFGAFFEFSHSDGAYEDDRETIAPLSPEEARLWLEKYKSQSPEIIESLFGEMPEAGSSEVKYTLRMPESFRNRLNEKAKENSQSLNAWIIRCLERCAAGDSTNV